MSLDYHKKTKDINLFLRNRSQLYKYTEADKI